MPRTHDKPEPHNNQACDEAAVGSSAARGVEVAPSIGREKKVKVILEPRQTESNIEDKGGLARVVWWKF
jgi:hypothetical protein